MSFFSIILPTYNRAHFLPKAIESVLAQTFEDWELIIVDDGSTDNTKEVIAKYEDSRIRYFFQENQERSAARNNGIEQAQGEYVCFLDSDDYYLNEKLVNLYKTIDSSAETIIYIDGLLTEFKGVIIKVPLAIKTEDQSWSEFIVSNPIFSQQVCGHREIFKEFKYNPRIRIGEDMELWVRITEKFKFRPVLESFQTVIVEHNDRSIHIQNSDVYFEQLKTLRFIFSGFKLKNIRRSIKYRVLSNCYFNIAKHYMFSAEKLKAFFWILVSLVYNLRNNQFRHKLYCLILLMRMEVPKEYQKLKEHEDSPD